MWSHFSLEVAGRLPIVAFIANSLVQEKHPVQSKNQTKKIRNKNFGPCTRVHTDRKKAILYTFMCAFCISRNFFQKTFDCSMQHKYMCVLFWMKLWSCASTRIIHCSLPRTTKQILNSKSNWLHCSIHVQFTGNIFRVSTWNLFLLSYLIGCTNTCNWKFWA